MVSGWQGNLSQVFLCLCDDLIIQKAFFHERAHRNQAILIQVTDADRGGLQAFCRYLTQRNRRSLHVIHIEIIKYFQARMLWMWFGNHDGIFLSLFISHFSQFKTRHH